MPYAIVFAGSSKSPLTIWPASLATVETKPGFTGGVPEEFPPALLLLCSAAAWSTMLSSPVGAGLLGLAGEAELAGALPGADFCCTAWSTMLSMIISIHSVSRATWQDQHPHQPQRRTD